MILEILFRPNAPLWVKFFYLLFVFFIGLYAGLRKGWFSLLFEMAVAPFSRFKWKMDNLKIPFDLVIFSLLSYTFITVLLMESLLPNLSQVMAVYFGVYPLFGLILAILMALVLKIVLVYFYFAAHKQAEEGIHLINFQLGFNQILIFIATIWLSIVIFYLRFSPLGLDLVIWIYGVFWAFRLYGTILFLLIKFNYSVITIFAYLCTFEIIPYILVARIVFMIS